jgi:eukaryotic-like serine/threonine-protein kinase
MLAGFFGLQGKHAEATALYRKAIELDPKYAATYYKLGSAMHSQGKLEEAATLNRKAIELDPQISVPHINLSDILLRQGKPGGAEAHARRAVALSPQHPYANANLVEALLGRGHYPQAAEAARHCLTLLGPRDPLRKPAEQTLRLAGLGDRLPAVLRGDDRPASAAEDLDFARLCQYQWRLAAAARLYAAAFAADPMLADDLQAGDRFRAAVAAVQASASTGTDVSAPNEKERARLRQQAREWLRADLVLHGRQPAAASSGPDRAIANLRLWLTTDELAGVRETPVLARLPEPERKEWEALWAEVQALVDKKVAK